MGIQVQISSTQERLDELAILHDPKVVEEARLPGLANWMTS